MYREQEFGVIMLFICIATVFLATALQAIDNYSIGISSLLNTIYLAGIVILFWTGYNTYKIFQSDYNISDYHRNKDKGYILYDIS